MSPKPVSPEDVTEDDRGMLGLEVLKDKEWVDATVLVPPDPEPEPEPEPEPCEEEDTKMSEQEYELRKESESLHDGFEVSWFLFCLFMLLSLWQSRIDVWGG